MTDLTDDSASAEPVDVSVDEATALLSGEPEQQSEEAALEGEQAEGEAEDDGLIDWEDEDGSVYRVPAKVREGLMLKADHTRKTMELAEVRKAAEARVESLNQREARQAEFAGHIAQLGVLNARLAPFSEVTDWASYIAQGGPEAHAHWAQYQALTTERDRFAQGLTQLVQQRMSEEQRETVELVEKGRAELAKHIKGYDAKTLDELVAFGTEYGFSPDEIRGAEADPKSIRILHLAQIGARALQAQQKTQQLAQGQKTQPVQTLRGAAGSKSPDKMSPSEMAKHLGYRG